MIGMAGYGVKNGMVSVTFLLSMLYNCDARVYLTAQRLSFGGTKHNFFCTPKILVRTGTNRTATLRRTCTCDRKLPPILNSHCDTGDCAALPFDPFLSLSRTRPFHLEIHYSFALLLYIGCTHFAFTVLVPPDPTFS